MSDSEYERVLNTARIVLSLLTRSETPPEPPAYEAVFGALAPGDALTHDQLREAVAKRLAEDAERRRHGAMLGQQLGDDIGLFEETLQSAAATNSAYTKALENAEAAVAAAPTAPALRAVLARVIEDTTRMQRANKVLARRVAEAGQDIATVRSSIDAIRRDASIDSLTRIGNRRHFDDLAQQTIGMAQARSMPLSLVLFDIDHFRRFNETYGHQMGDEVLRIVARILTGLTQRIDLIARIGGEEFAVMLPGRDLAQATEFSDRLRSQLRMQAIAAPSDERDMERITASYGVAELRVGESAATLMERADRCLYAAKKAGRDRVVAEGDPGMAEGGDAAATPASEVDDDGQSLLELAAVIH